MSQPQAALSVDFEFFAHLPAYRGARGTTDRPAVGLGGVTSLLDAFDDAEATGTFFTVGEIADSHPRVLERVADAGHEVGSHTQTHRHLSELDADDRRTELARSKERLEAVTGEPVTGFRAPSFDLGPDHFRTLADAGYDYDSSVVPCRSIPGWYGGEFDAERPTRASAVERGAPETLAEVPVAVMPRLGLPLTGTWVRFFGVEYTILGMRLLARRGVPPVLYVHPWELVDLPAVDGVPKRVYVRTGAYMRRAVRRILSQPFEFVAVGDLAEAVDGVGSPEVVDGTDPSAAGARSE
ncbi:polysaccharide deacetylase [Halosimplex carlsbadense 2-9-1]|uniref:Polysaccharide deacetylase n=1 Tax=Halosimplex carlsbadense 2-9-1 TaxID=797114 RepID=M0CN95_9EURY|nr:polysaccharide deacetylase family protein [Halosimplex carlsbadense]ELZ24083.1 polysaccharide deacetylase [Halosimplex carlsbadense 2-9-1]